MGYLVEGLELFIRKVAYTKYDTTVLVHWSNFTHLTHLEPSSSSAHLGGKVIICFRIIILYFNITQLTFAVKFLQGHQS
jgi:hypothetical protein